LFPAFYFMCLVSFVTAYFLFTPEHLAHLSGALIYSLTAISNFYFYIESGYFDSSAFLKPLLHTWTLSVEEQFYLFWPLLLLLSNKSGRQWMTPVVILVLGLTSLYFAEQMMLTDPDAAFYLIPFRAVEFAIGGILVWCISYQPNAKIVVELATLVGLLMIAYSVCQYTNEIVFPGFSSLLPCIGAALVIYGGTSRLAGGLLGNFVAVRIGLISYSLYLAHWPIIVFYKYYRFEEVETLSGVEMALILFASLFTATSMYVSIEKPFRISAGKTKKLSVCFYRHCEIHLH
jgi:peptidoglycan/LPS O-acetylase OafA/YrhL